MLTIHTDLKVLTQSDDIGGATLTLVGSGSNVPRTPGAVLSTLCLTAKAVDGVITQTLIGNDMITPPGTSYVVEVFSSLGGYVWTGRYQLSGSGTVDLNNLLQQR